MQELLTSLLDLFGLAWWVEIKTEAPRCTYYFGPFLSAPAAEVAKPGYVEDLEQEGALGISIAVKRCKPTTLTVFDDVADKSSQRVPRTLSGQLY